jgi:hypothetical protein
MRLTDVTNVRWNIKRYYLKYIHNLLNVFCLLTSASVIKNSATKRQFNIAVHTTKCISLSSRRRLRTNMFEFVCSEWTNAFLELCLRVFALIYPLAFLLVHICSRYRRVTVKKSIGNFDGFICSEPLLLEYKKRSIFWNAVCLYIRTHGCTTR